MRVLLISPVPDVDPPTGDVAYTQTLLASPPPGVVYDDYVTALRKGTLTERGRRGGQRQSAPDLLLRREQLVNRARRRGLLFREPFRFFTVDEQSYDLVHCHVFSAQILPTSLPLVVSNGADLPDLYLRARGWSARRVGAARRADRLLATAQGVEHSTLRLRRADKVVCFSDDLRAWMLAHHAATNEQLEVVPAGAERAPRRPPAVVARVIGFIATDFVAKGGQTVLAAFDIARRSRPDLELVVAGSEPRLPATELAERHITWHERLPHAQLLEDVLPGIDVLAYPTEFDGTPIVVQEALGAGIPVATSNHRALPEMVQPGRGGLVSPMGDAPALAANLLRLLDPTEHGVFRAGAAAVFDERFDVAVAHRRLREVYDDALSAARARS